MLALLKQAPGVRLVTKIDPAEHFDYQVHLFSLPRAFKTRLDNVPAHFPYFFADPALAAAWGDRLGSHGFKIGIAWQGNPDPKIDIARAARLRISRRSRLFRTAASSVSKRVMASSRSLAPGAGRTLGHDFDAGPNAFIDTAAVMANLDLIVTVDTSSLIWRGPWRGPWVALKHIPEWRWMLGSDGSPWYPTMRLFRQRAMGDWEGVFADMAEALKTLMAKKDRNRPVRFSFPLPSES